MAGCRVLYWKAKPMPASLHALRLLILGGTTEATMLCQALEGQSDIAPILSLAGVTRTPHLPKIAVKIGGFGGSNGLRHWLQQNAIKAVIDATHPFAATMSYNVALACNALNIPLLRLERPAWQPTPQDRWHTVPNLQAAAHMLATPALWGNKHLTVFLTTGRKETAPFQAVPQHHYVLRSIDSPDAEALPQHTTLITARGPFDLAAEIATLRHYQFDYIVTKNSGGKATFPKIEAARQLNIPVIMVNRPAPAATPCVATATQALHWLKQYQTASTLRDV